MSTHAKPTRSTDATRARRLGGVLRHYRRAA